MTVTMASLPPDPGRRERSRPPAAVPADTYETLAELGSGTFAKEHDHDVFVASSEHDREWVRGYLLDALEAAGISFCDESSFELGVPTLTSMERAVHGSRRTVAVFSRAFRPDEDNDFLVSLTQAWGAHTRTWPLIPVLLQDVTLPPRLRMLGVLDLRDPAAWERGVDRLVQTLGRDPPPARRAPSCPYPGMRPYTFEESADFVGREREIRALVERLRSSPRQCVIGPSGSGKSSLVVAGVAPRLEGHPAFLGDAWKIHIVRPGLHPLDSIADSFELERCADPHKLIEDLDVLASSRMRLLVLDQAEELFTLARDQVPDLASLLEALGQLSRVRTILTLRADFYAPLMESPLWPLVEHHQFRILPLDHDGLRTALVEPAERVGVYVEPALVERLIHDASGEPGMLPFLQVTMRLLWQRIERRLLTLSGYEALVLPDVDHGVGHSNGLLIALSRHADGALDRLDGQQRAIARRVLLRLVQFGEGRSNVRRQQAVQDLQVEGDPPEAFEITLSTLTDYRLVTTGTKPSASGEVVTVDLSHEAMITGWPTLASWIEQHREAERKRRRLREQAEEWTRLGRSAGGLLDDVQLAGAERYLADEATVDIGIDPAIRELVAASRSRADQRRRRQRAMAAALVTTTCIALAFGAWAFASQRIASTEALRSQSMLLARVSETDVDDPALAGLLSLEALRRSDTVEARGALLASLVSAPGLEARWIEDRQSLLSVVVSREAGLVAAAGSTNEPAPSSPRILLWDLRTSELAGVLEGRHDDEVTALAFTPDGTSLASAGRDDRVVLWDLAEQQATRVLQADPDDLPADVPRCRGDDEPDTIGDVRALAFSPDGKVLASGGHDQLIRLWDLAEGGDRHLSGHACDVLGLAFAPDGSELVSVSRDDTVRFWDPATGEESDRLGQPDLSAWGSPESTAGDLRAVAYRPDGKQVAYAGQDGHITLVPTRRPLVPQPSGPTHTERVFGLAYSPDGALLASASRDRSIRISSDGGQVEHVLPDHARSVAWLDERRLLSVGGQEGVRIWEPGRLSPLVTRLDGAGATRVAVLVGDSIVGARDDGDLIVWDADGVARTAPAPPGAGAARSIATLGDGRVVVGHETGHLSLWNIAGPVLGGVWLAHGAPVTAVGHPAPGGTVASGDADGVVILWDPAAGPEAGRRVGVSDCTVRALVASETSGVGLACNEADSVRWWGPDVDVARPRAIHRGDRVSDLVLANDGRLLLGASIDGTTVAWTVDPLGSPRAAPSLLRARAGEVRAVVIDEGPRTRIIAGGDGGIQLWDLQTSSTIGPPLALGEVRDLSLSDDGGRLIAVTATGVLDIAVDENRWREIACRRAGRELTALEWNQYVEQGRVVEPSCS
jgi:WD40 repeat protein